MLEALVSSRIRRALFEHILSNPTERFYLRGLAKALNLSISPLRRELKRLERSGMLRAEEEGNMLFYTVDRSSPAFLELARVTLTVQTNAPATAGMTKAPSGVSVAELPAPDPVPAGAGVAKASLWQSPLSTPMLVGAAGVGMALVLVVTGLAYLNLTNQRMLSQASRVLSTKQADVTVVVPQPSSSGVMRGARWQVVPGGFGGFSSAKEQESY